MSTDYIELMRKPGFTRMEKPCPRRGYIVLSGVKTAIDKGPDKCEGCEVYGDSCFESN